MLTLGAPLFLLAGALAALIPLALHLIRRRPPSRSPLPTARFLAEDARNSIRVSHPTDRMLLAMRMLLLILAGAALANPRWIPAPEGTREVALLDRSGGMRESDAWSRGVAAARPTLLAPDGSARGELVLIDTAAVHIPSSRITAALFDSLAAAGPGAQAASYPAALRAIGPVARDLRGADSVRVTMLSALRWGGWRPGTAALRRAAWPGAIDLPEILALPFSPVAGEPVAPAEAHVLTASGGRFVMPALQAVGWRVQSGTIDRLPPSVGLIFVIEPRGDAAFLRQRAVAGATVVVDAAGAGAAMSDWLPVRGPLSRLRNDAGDLWLAPDLRVPGAIGRADVLPKRGARVVGAWDDGRAAVAAAGLGRGCVVYVGTRLEDGDFPLSAAFPRALERMGRACDPASPGDAMLPLDAGARAILAGRGAPVVAASGGAGGVAFGRWLMGCALLVALAETFLAYGRRNAR
ncbi:MAG TPA: BatA domain-containing protein [Longimicrobium sp.]